MGITADVGQHYIDIVNEVCEELGVDVYDDTNVYGWCYEHDNNTAAGCCSVCPPKHNYPDNDDDFRKKVREWIEEGRY